MAVEIFRGPDHSASRSGFSGDHFFSGELFMALVYLVCAGISLQQLLLPRIQKRLLAELKK